MKRALEQLGARHGLSPQATVPLERLLDLLHRDPSAPTAVRSFGDVTDVHLADSLAGLEVPALKEAGLLVDVGSGAGLPGLVLAAALPDTHVVLVESTARKAAWIEKAARTMGLEKVEVLAVRAEGWDRGPVADGVTARALAALPVLVEYAAPILRVGGRLVAWKGVPDEAEEEDGTAAAEKLGLELEEVRPVQPFPAARDRRLYVYRKITVTPSGYPRRPGMAVKRPLRADRGPR